jgi:large subunit ribosomal protein L7/L12
MATTPDHGERVPTREEIAQCAYQLWQARGGTHGSDRDDWLAAEAMLRGAASPRAESRAADAMLRGAASPRAESRALPPRFDVILQRVGDDELRVVRAIRDATGLDLATIKALTDAAPVALRTGLTASQAEALRDAVNAAGAAVELRRQV